MALMPKRIRRRKQQRGRLKGFATRNNHVTQGEFGLQSLEFAWISAQVIEAARVACNRALGGVGRVHIRIFPHKPITKKPAETRQGKGKGEPDWYAAIAKPGTMLYEVSGCSEEMAKKALLNCAHKLPIKVRFVKRRPVI